MAEPESGPGLGISWPPGVLCLSLDSSVLKPLKLQTPLGEFASCCVSAGSCGQRASSHRCGGRNGKRRNVPNPIGECFTLASVLQVLGNTRSRRYYFGLGSFGHIKKTSLAFGKRQNCTWNSYYGKVRQKQRAWTNLYEPKARPMTPTPQKSKQHEL